MTRVMPIDDNSPVLSIEQLERYETLPEALEPMILALDYFAQVRSSTVSDPRPSPTSPATPYHPGSEDGLAFQLRLEFASPVPGSLVREAAIEADFVLDENISDQPSTTHTIQLKRL